MESIICRHLLIKTRLCVNCIAPAEQIITTNGDCLHLNYKCGVCVVCCV